MAAMMLPSLVPAGRALAEFAARRNPGRGDSCVIPGHHQIGTEVHVDELRSTAAPLEYAFRGRCGYEAPFAYSSDDGQR
jgi:hypothetical protein